MNKHDFIREIECDGRNYNIFDINIIEQKGIAPIRKLPFSIKILVENLLRKLDGRFVTEDDVIHIAGWKKKYDTPVEIPYYPGRILMQDFTGVPAIVDLAAMRDAVKKLGGDPEKINPHVPIDLIIDHSLQVDFFGTSDALEKNVEKEYQRNRERYLLLKWAQKNFNNFRVVPPNSGICHQINLENLGNIVSFEEKNGQVTAFPDTLIGTDSHTTMINGIGVMGWGVGGITAEAVMLGQPYCIPIPEVIGVRITGELNECVTATDLVLTITEMLREYNVVDKFVEYFGPGIKALEIGDRATIANMAPEYGATLGFFPVDEKTVEYLKMTNRKDSAGLTEIYTKTLGLFYSGDEEVEYTDVIELDISAVEPSVAGPARPKDRISLKNIKSSFGEILNGKYEKNAGIKYISNFFDESGTSTFREAVFEPKQSLTHDFGLGRASVKIRDGSIVIAAITSCSNTSNPYVMIGSGLLAKKAVEKGIRISPYVKTSMAPGSRVVVKYLKSSGLLPYLESLGFHLAGFGCTTCIGNSGPLHPEIEKVIAEKELVVTSVLSGNRNFEARIHQNVQGNFLMSPMLVVAFALAGRIDIDFEKEPISLDPNGRPVYLKDIWPTRKEIKDISDTYINPEMYEQKTLTIFEGDTFWKNLPATKNTTFDWDDRSTYIKKPPYFNNFHLEHKKPSDIHNARPLLLLGDSVTTDHISPAGKIQENYPASMYLESKNVAPIDYNSYGSRRGNHDVMVRGTFGNTRIKNKIITPDEGSYTIKFPANKKMFIYDAAMDYKDEHVPLVVLAGKEYGTGSSRDWAAKGSSLLGIKAIIAESYERIHRSNLVGMGVLPLEFINGDSCDSLGLDGTEVFNIYGLEDITPRKNITVKAVRANGNDISFEVTARLDTYIEVEYYENGGIMGYVLRQLLKD